MISSVGSEHCLDRAGVTGSNPVSPTSKMENILFVKTFSIVGGMLLITTIFSRINRDFETWKETYITIVGLFLFLILAWVYGDQFPINIVMVGIYSGFVGWSLGPFIVKVGKNFRFKEYLKTIGVKKIESEGKLLFYYENDGLNPFESDSDEMEKIKNKFNKEVIEKDHFTYSEKWRNIVFQAMASTSMAIFLALIIVSMTDIDFGFLGLFLFIALTALIIGELLNYFKFKSTRYRRFLSYCGVIIFSLYLVYDFNRLEKAAAKGDESWSTAVSLAINIYLDIINLFMDLLQLLGDSF